MKLQIYSIATMTALLGLVVGIILGAGYFFGYVSLSGAIFLAIIINVLMLFLNPIIMDFTNKWIYHTKYYESFDELKNAGYEFSEFLKSISSKYNIKFPRVGIIDDGAITAYTYGSRQNNARIVLTRGIIDTLNKEELEAVIAHEFGHIKHRDFIVMTIASTVLQILYLLYLKFRFGAMAKSNNKNAEKTKAIMAAFAGISLLFYLIGSYIVLFLSRTREYYADKFAAKNSSAKNLSDALIKIGYGISTLKLTKKSEQLLSSTRNLNLMDYKYASSMYSKNISNAIKYDIFSPWASVIEFNSTHPMIGKRVKALIGFRETISPQIKSKLWINFFKDIFVHSLNLSIFLLTIIVAIFNSSMKVPIIIGGLVLNIIASFLVMNYKYPSDNAKIKKIADLSGDLFASPVRGQKVIIEGTGMGRGTPGFALSEDFLVRDDTGFIYTNYEHWMPFANYFIGYKKIRKLINKPVKVEGWFFRKYMNFLNANLINNNLKSYVKLKEWMRVLKYIALYLLVFLI